MAEIRPLTLARLEDRGAFRLFGPSASLPLYRLKEFTRIIAMDSQLSLPRVRSQECDLVVENDPLPEIRPGQNVGACPRARLRPSIWPAPPMPGLVISEPQAKSSRMSALGQKQTFGSTLGMSALPPKADIVSGSANVR